MNYSLIAIILLLLFAVRSHAVSFEGRVHAVSVAADGETLLKFDNGLVGYLTRGNKVLLPPRGSTVQVTLSEDHDVLALQVLAAAQRPERVQPKTFNQAPPATTVFESFDEVQNIFQRLNNTYKTDSECYNRAHVWSYEEFTRHQVVLNKAFVFFSDNYIRTFKFKWWFHVAPYALYKHRGAIYAAVLDHQFSSGAQSLKSWTDTWIEHRRACRSITRYSEYFDNFYRDDCYLIKVNMFYWQPRDIEAAEKGIAPKASFLPDELAHAYEEAFGR
jgi:hypothetical protein